MSSIKEFVKGVVDYGKNHKLATCCAIIAGLAFSQKAWVVGTVATIYGLSFHVIDHFLDNSVSHVFHHLWSTATPEMRRELIRIAAESGRTPQQVLEDEIRKI